MNHAATLLVLPILLLGYATSQDSRSQNTERPDRESGKAENRTIPNKNKNVQVILQIFDAIERRDIPAMTALLQPDVEFVWPAPLPYAGRARLSEQKHPGWGETWIPLQPTEAERRLDPRVVAANDDEVVVLWHQRGKSPAGERFESEVLGLYRFREGKLARAQMFDFDAAGAAQFLLRAKSAPEQPAH